MTYSELLDYLENLPQEKLDNCIQVMCADGELKDVTMVLRLDFVPGADKEDNSSWQTGDIILW